MIVASGAWANEYRWTPADWKFTPDGYLIVDGEAVMEGNEQVQRITFNYLDGYLWEGAEAGHPLEFRQMVGGKMSARLLELIRNHRIPTRIRAGRVHSAGAFAWFAGVDCRSVAAGAPCRSIAAGAKACFHQPSGEVEAYRRALASSGADAEFQSMAMAKSGQAVWCPDHGTLGRNGVRVQ